MKNKMRSAEEEALWKEAYEKFGAVETSDWLCKDDLDPPNFEEFLKENGYSIEDYKGGK